MNSSDTTLPEMLAQNMDSILERLIIRLKKAGGPGYTDQPVEILRTRVQRLVDVFWHSIAQNNPALLTKFISSTTRERSSQGYNIRQAQRVAVILRRVLLEMVDEFYADNPTLRLANSRHIEDMILSGFGAGAFGIENGHEAVIARQEQALRQNNQD